MFSQGVGVVVCSIRVWVWLCAQGVGVVSVVVVCSVRVWVWSVWL